MEMTPEEELEWTIKYIEKAEEEMKKLEKQLEEAEAKGDYDLAWEIGEKLTDYEFSIAEAKSELPWIRARIGI
jgi:phage shock protein A